MKLTTVATVAGLFAGLPLAAASGELGLSLGVKRNSDGQCKESSDYESDFDTLSKYTDTVRVYAASDCNTLQNIGPALEAKNFKLYLGIWPNDDAHFAAEQEALKTYLPTISKDVIRGITVGSEALYRNDMSAQELAGKIGTIKQVLKGISDKNGNSYGDLEVGTVDSWEIWVDLNNKPAIQAADFVFANAFSYWQGQLMNNASYSFNDDIFQALQQIQNVKGTDNFDFWIGETGWPTEGENFQGAVPSVDNAKQFWQEGICAIRAWGINTFVFEAFDEAWKPESSGNAAVEKHWGILDPNGTPKYNLNCDY